MIILGVDPGTINCGFGIVESNHNKFDHISSSVITFPKIFDIPEKLDKIYTILAEQIRTYSPSELSLETAFYSKNVQSVLKIGYVRGVVMLISKHFNLNFAEYSPREIKKSLTGSGASSKEQVSFMVKTLLNIKSIEMGFDQSDAIAVALCHGFKNKIPETKGGGWKSFVESNPGKIIG